MNAHEKNIDKIWRQRPEIHENCNFYVKNLVMVWTIESSLYSSFVFIFVIDFFFSLLFHVVRSDHVQIVHYLCIYFWVYFKVFFFRTIFPMFSQQTFHIFTIRLSIYLAIVWNLFRVFTWNQYSLGFSFKWKEENNFWPIDWNNNNIIHFQRTIFDLRVRRR